MITRPIFEVGAVLMDQLSGRLLLSVLVGIIAFGSTTTAAGISYSYDKLGRVTTAVYDTGVCIAYSYDPNGNRTSQTNTISGAPVSPIWGSGVWGCFSWTPQ